MKITKGYLTEICRRIRGAYDLGERLNDYDEHWIIDNVFVFHKRWAEKSKDMDYIYVDKNKYNSVSFWIHYKDGHNDDISFLKCISNMKIN